MGGWQIGSAHVDHHIEFRPAQLPDILRKVVGQIDVLRRHCTQGVGSYAECGRYTGARSDDYIISVSAGKPLRHLAAARVSNAYEQNALLLGSRHSFSRNSL